MIGVPATEYVIKHSLELINNFVNDYCYSMDIDPMLEQLLKYSYENKNKTAKNLKIGNNSSSQEIVDYILNISSYETQIEVEVKSNKNSNKYKMKQKINERI